MKINVFLRSTLRQPVRTILLLLITALLTCVFVSKGAEYLLIDQETEELGGYYRSIGTLTTGNVPDDRTADVSEAADWLEENPYVASVDRIQTVSAVADVRNVDTNLTNPTHMNADVYFYGTLLNTDSWYVADFRGAYPQYSFLFKVDTILVGYDEHLFDGMTVYLTTPIGGLEIYARQPHYYAGSPYGRESIDTKTLVDPYVDLSGVYEELEFEAGKQYLVHGVYEEAGNMGNHLYSLDRGEERDYAVFTMRSLTDDLWYYPVAEGEEADFSDPALAGVAEAIRRVDDNQHALLFFGSEDVSHMPGIQKDAAGNVTVLTDATLTAGRWPDAQDNAEENRVCAIHGKLAAVRGLTVGDTLTVTFRELLNMSNAPYLCMSDDLEREDEMPVSEAVTFEIVGIYETDNIDEYYFSYLYSNVYAPASTLPQTFSAGPLSPGYFSFTLTSPEVEDQFIVETRDALSALGFQATFLPTNYDSFRSAARPMRFSALYNTVIFSMVLVVALCLVVFLYFRMRRKDVAIARALGLPVSRCVRQVSLPQLLIGLVGILTGGCAGWRYTLENAGQTLSTLSEIVEENGTAMAALSIGWLVLLLASCFALLLILTLGSAVLTAKKPVLVQLQGGTTLPQP